MMPGGGKPVMNCQDFDDAWNLLLDAETRAKRARVKGLAPSDQVLADLEQTARAHAQECERCRTAQERFDSLRPALRAWTAGESPASQPSPGLVDRIIAAHRLDARAHRARPWKLAAGAAAAIAAGALIFAFLPARPTAVPANVNPMVKSHDSSPSEPRFLSDALADATEATWDLARATSEPAARLGRQVLEGGRDANEAETRASAPIVASTGRRLIPPLNLQISSLAPARGDWLQDVGNGLSSSVEPLSSTAARAFGFLSAPFAAKSDATTPPPAPKGA
jgi:hypothetical protein